MQRFAGALLDQACQELGVAGLGKTGFVQHVLGDRIGDDRRRLGRQHVGDGSADRRDRRRRTRSIRAAGTGGDGNSEFDYGQRRGKRRGRRGGRNGCERRVEAQRGGAATQKALVGNDVERRKVQLAAPVPDRNGKIGTDPGRLAERQGYGQHGPISGLSGLSDLSTLLPEPYIQSWPGGAKSQDSVWPARRISAGTSIRGFPSFPASQTWFP